MTAKDNQRLSEKVKKLGNISDGLSKIISGKTSFFIHQNEFVILEDEKNILLKIESGYDQKLIDALNTDARSSYDGVPDGWVRLHMDSDIDVEFVFLYIRQAWKSF